MLHVHRSGSRLIGPAVALLTVLALSATALSTTLGERAEAAGSAVAAACDRGNVLGFARVKGGASIPTFYTNSSAVIDITHNCAGGSVEVRRSAPGVYFVRFNGNPAALAVVSANQDGASTAFSGDNDNIVAVGKISSGGDAGSFRVDVQDVDKGATDGHKPQDGQFTILMP